MNTNEPQFHLVMFNTMYVQDGSHSEYVDEILVRDHSNESYWAILSRGTVYYAVQGGVHSQHGDETWVWPLKQEPLSSVFYVVLFITYYKVVLDIYEAVC